jgi:dTDP-4-dehydrorhamnose reductase
MNYYGLTKLLGECYALSYDEALVIRTSGVFKSKGFPLHVIRLLKRNQKVKALRGYYSPISARRLALAIYQLVKLKKTGILHVASERVSRFEFANLIAERLGLPKLIEEVDDLGLFAKRPFDSSLNCSRARALLRDSLLSLQATLEDLLSYSKG